MIDPNDWLAGFEARLADLKTKSESLQENIASAGATVSSGDRSVTVTVGPNGGLQNLELGPRACDLGPAKLTATILDTVRKAQRETSANLLAAFEPLGDGTEAIDLVMDAMPEAADEDHDTAAVAVPARPRSADPDDEFDRPW